MTPARPSSPHYLVAGLGNPGTATRFSRHNAGQIAASLLFAAAGGTRYRKYGDAWLGDVSIDGTAVAVLLPRTWMNVSGRPVAAHARRLGVPPGRVIVLHDDTGNQPGHVTGSSGAEASSHLGLKSVAKALGTSEFPRIKIGIGAPADWSNDFYLNGLHGDEKRQLLDAGRKAAILARSIVSSPASGRSGAGVPGSDPWESPPDESQVVAVPPSLKSRLERARNRTASLAAAVLVPAARLWRRTGQRHLRIVTVIGTYGKTTTRAAIYHGLGPARVGRHWPWWAQFNAEAGPALHMVSLWPWRRYGVVEVAGGKPGAMDKHGPVVQPDIVVMTSIGSEHQERWPDLATKAAGKARMLNYLRAPGVFIANCDDPHVAEIAAKFSGRVIRYGFGAEADVRATHIALQFPEGTRFTAHVGRQRWDLTIPGLGEHAVRSALAALAVAYVDQLPLPAMIDRLQSLAPVAGRMSVVQAPNGAWLIRDDYKGPIETFDFALDVLARVPAARKVVVAGDIDVLPGQQGDAYRQVGGRIGQTATRFIIVGRNVERFTRAAARAGLAKEAIVPLPLAYTEAAAQALAHTGPGDVILVKGRASDRVQRVSLAILGREVRCRRYPCRHEPTCDDCKMLGKP